LKAKKLANFKLTCKMPFSFQPSKLACQQHTTELTVVGSNWAQCLRPLKLWLTGILFKLVVHWNTGKTNTADPYTILYL